MCLYPLTPAHTTQFTKPGYHYLQHNYGAGHLDNGGSYVTFMDPDTEDFTIVIETMVITSSVYVLARLVFSCSLTITPSVFALICPSMKSKLSLQPLYWVGAW